MGGGYLWEDTHGTLNQTSLKPGDPPGLAYTPSSKYDLPGPPLLSWPGWRGRGRVLESRLFNEQKRGLGQLPLAGPDHPGRDERREGWGTWWPELGKAQRSRPFQGKSGCSYGHRSGRCRQVGVPGRNPVPCGHRPRRGWNRVGARSRHSATRHHQTPPSVGASWEPRGPLGGGEREPGAKVLSSSGRWVTPDAVGRRCPAQPGPAVLGPQKRKRRSVCTPHPPSAK